MNTFSINPLIRDRRSKSIRNSILKDTAGMASPRGPVKLLVITQKDSSYLHFFQYFLFGDFMVITCVLYRLSFLPKTRENCLDRPLQFCFTFTFFNFIS